jgi:hypothetical protein
MGSALPQTAPTARSVHVLGWFLVGLVMAAAAVVSVVELNRLAILALVTLPLAALVVLHIELGVVCLVVYSSLLAFFVRMLPPANSGPIGLALDGILVLMLLRLGWDMWHQRNFHVFRSPLTVVVLLFLGYQGLEVFNPAAPSIWFGLYGLRVTLRMAGFFLVIYYFRSRKAILRLVIGWLVLLLGVGAYGIFQHHHGLLWQEMRWLLTEGNAQTHILKGYVRVFSTVGDAATFGFLMIIGVLFACALALGSPWRWRLPLLLGCLPLLYAMAASYSRGPVVALVAGVMALLLAARNFWLATGIAAFSALGVAVLLATGSGQLLDRLSTAARPDEDASFNVRMSYVNTYLPEIAQRPFGFGINTSGGGARRVSGGEGARGSVVGVPTDNYYFKVALEMGWVGLGLWLWLNAALLWHAFRVHHRLRDPQLKAVALGNASVLIAIAVGALSNDILAQKPIAELFWLCAGLVVVLGQYRTRSVAPVRRPIHTRQGAYRYENQPDRLG